ncbi:DUF3017 domain-containing protein [Xylanimonas oleitrophica]|uniref:DUF3017 domain-containing protein n=1 Tax=Xylanimonas oleitrophica TaxID=2607479 RepID=UPI001FE892A1|nr:DUF3017 domain-containing protein [Xylanimonas oleitrophica]
MEPRSAPGPDAPTPPSGTGRFRGPDPRLSLVVAMSGITVAALLGAFVSARLGALAIALTLAVAGTWRALAPRATQAAGIAVRGKGLDVFTYLAMASVIAFLALTVPRLG